MNLNLLCVRVNLWFLRKEFAVLQYQMDCIGFSSALAKRRAAILADINTNESYILTQGIQLS